MKLSDRKHKLTCFVIMTLVLIKMGLYWPNFSLLFLIHLFLYAGVYCIYNLDLSSSPTGLFRSFTASRALSWLRR